MAVLFSSLCSLLADTGHNRECSEKLVTASEELRELRDQQRVIRRKINSENSFRQ